MAGLGWAGHGVKRCSNNRCTKKGDVQTKDVQKDIQKRPTERHAKDVWLVCCPVFYVPKRLFYQMQGNSWPGKVRGQCWPKLATIEWYLLIRDGYCVYWGVVCALERVVCACTRCCGRIAAAHDRLPVWYRKCGVRFTTLVFRFAFHNNPYSFSFIYSLFVCLQGDNQGWIYNAP